MFDNARVRTVAFARDFVEAAKAAMKAGKSVNDAVSGLKLPYKYKDYNRTNLNADVQLVYDELKRTDKGQ